MEHRLHGKVITDGRYLKMLGITDPVIAKALLSAYPVAFAALVAARESVKMACREAGLTDRAKANDVFAAVYAMMIGALAANCSYNGVDVFTRHATAIAQIANDGADSREEKIKAGEMKP